MITRTVRLPLNRRVKRYISSGNYNDYLDKSFTFLDTFYTWCFRYPWLLDDLQGKVDTYGVTIDATAENKVISVGLTLILGAAAIAIYVDEYRAQDRAERERAEAYQSSYKLIAARLRDKARPASVREFSLSEASTVTEEEPSDFDSDLDEEEKLEPSLLSSPTNSFENDLTLLDIAKKSRESSLNEYIAKLLLQDAELRNKYKKIIITEDGELEFSLNDENVETENKPGFLKRLGKKSAALAYAAWMTMNICSFAYWLVWIGCGVLTGDFASFGVAGMGAAGFAVPLVAALIYPVIKIRNWWRNNYGQKIEKQENGAAKKLEEDPRLVLAAAADASRIMKKAIFAVEIKRLQEELVEFGGATYAEALDQELDENTLRYDEELLILGQDKWKKSAVTMLDVTINAYVMAQYGAWFVTDIAKAAGTAALNAGVFCVGLGIAFMVCSVAYGLYKAGLRYKEVKKYQRDLAAQELRLEKQKCGLEETYENKAKEISRLKQAIGNLSNDPAELEWLARQNELMASATLVEPAPEKPAQALNWRAKAKQFLSRAYVFACSSTTGIMIARIATIANTAIYLPFAAAALSTPWTIGILVAVGLIYGLIKVYQYHQAKKEARAKAMFEARADKIETLKGQVKVADLQIQLLAAKEKELLKKEAEKAEMQEQAVNPPQPPMQPGFRTGARDDLSLMTTRRTVGFSYAAANQSVVERRSLDDLDKPRSAAFYYELAARGSRC